MSGTICHLCLGPLKAFPTFCADPSGFDRTAFHKEFDGVFGNRRCQLRGVADRIGSFALTLALDYRDN